jgi:hypothetical protein
VVCIRSTCCFLPLRPGLKQLFVLQKTIPDQSTEANRQAPAHNPQATNTQTQQSTLKQLFVCSHACTDDLATAAQQCKVRLLRVLEQTGFVVIFIELLPAKSELCIE